MDISYDQDVFHCKLMASAWSADSDRKVFVYLILDATNVKAIRLQDNDEVPLDVTKEFIKQARCTTAADIVSLHLTLTQNVPLVVPDLALQHKPIVVKDIDTLLRLGRCETFDIYVPLASINHGRLSNLCEALSHGVVKTGERIIKTLYAGAGHKHVTHVNQLWSPDLTRCPPPYEPSTAPGASNHGTSQTGLQPSTSSRAHGKRRAVSPAVHQTPSKRQELMEKTFLEPWQLAFAALNAELTALREQVQQLQRAHNVDAGTQTDPVVEHEPEITPETNLVSSPVYSPVHSPAYQPV